MKKPNNSAFTLIEIMVVITIIAIVVLGATSINFNVVSDKKKLEITSTRIVSIIESIRNNSLLGKGIGINLDVPRKYKIEFGNIGPGNIAVSYSTGIVDSYSPYDNDSITNFGNDLTSIKNLECVSLTGSPSPYSIIAGTGIIILEGANMTLSGACSNSYKILDIQLSRKGFTKNIQINTLNGLISSKQ